MPGKQREPSYAAYRLRSKYNELLRPPSDDYFILKSQKGHLTTWTRDELFAATADDDEDVRRIRALRPGQSITIRGETWTRSSYRGKKHSQTGRSRYQWHREMDHVAGRMVFFGKAFRKRLAKRRRDEVRSIMVREGVSRHRAAEIAAMRAMAIDERAAPPPDDDWDE